MAKLEVAVNALFFPPPYSSLPTELSAEQMRIMRSDADTASLQSNGLDTGNSIVNVVTIYNNSDLDIHIVVQTTHFTSFRITPRQLVIPSRHEADIRVRLVDPNPHLLAADQSESSSVSSLRASETGSDSSSLSGQKKIRIPKVMVEWWFSNSESKRSQVILPVYFVAPSPTKFYNVLKGDEVMKRMPPVWPPVAVIISQTAAPEVRPEVALTLLGPSPVPPFRPPTPGDAVGTTNPSICLALENKLQQLQQSLAQKIATLEDLRASLANVGHVGVKPSGGQPLRDDVISDELLESQRAEVKELTQHLDSLRERLTQVTQESTRQIKALDATYAKWFQVQTGLNKNDHDSLQRVDQIETQIAQLNSRASRDGANSCSACTLM